jgi:hypothetical protein
MTDALELLFIALQLFVVLFLLLHDWVPLGRLNNLAAIRSEDSLLHRILVTLIAALPAGIGLTYSAVYFGRAYPHWLEMLLWITYGILMLGILRAWWIPYLVAPDAERAKRYQVIFAGTHSLLPKRNGIAPDTLHMLLHLAVVCTLIALLLRERMVPGGS